jgi:hypothetical protein
VRRLVSDDEHFHRRRSADLSAALANYKSENHGALGESAFRAGGQSEGNLERSGSVYINSDGSINGQTDPSLRVHVPDGSAGYFAAGGNSRFKMVTAEPFIVKSRTPKAQKSVMVCPHEIYVLQVLIGEGVAALNAT